MLVKPETCRGCPLFERGTGFMAPEGSGTNGVLLIAEALGSHEAQDGLPLRPNAPAGSILQGILRRLAGHERSHFLLSNVLWCQPPHNFLDGAPYEYASIETCVQYNRNLIATRRPRVIVTLGAVPTRTITGMHGYNQGIKLLRGFQLFATRPEYYVDGNPLPVIPTYHPSFLLRASKTRSRDAEGKKEGGKVEKAEGGMALSGVIMRDILQAISIAKTGPLARPTLKVVKGNREVMDNLIRDFHLHPEWPLYWDIETPRSLEKAEDESEIDSIQQRVTQIQFGHDKATGYVFPGFEAEWVKDGTAKLLSARGRRMLTWNGWKFDDKVVMGHYQVPILGINIDLMSAWSWLQPDLPKGLQFATSFFAPEIGPWKHLAYDAEDTYGMYDVISLAYDDEGIFKALEDRGLTTSYNRHVLTLRQEMVAASHRGFPVDKEEHDKFGRKVKVEIDILADQIRALVPEDILDVEPRRKPKGNSVAEYGFVNTPKQLLPRLDDYGNPKDGSDRITLCEEVPVEDDDGGAEDTPDVCERPSEPAPRMEVREVVYLRRGMEVFNKETLEKEILPRWCRLKPFSVGSVPAKKRYIEFRREQEVVGRMAGHTLAWAEVDGKWVQKAHKIKPQSRAEAERLAKYAMPKVRNKMKEMKDNTGAKELDKLYAATGDPVFRLLVEVSKLKKLYGTYYKGWKVIDGAVHTTFGLADTGTGQLSSVEPNVQNAPKHGVLAKAFRSCIKALPNKVLIELDKKSFHAQTLALAARDKAYARLSAIDVHSFMTAHRLNLPESTSLLSWSDKDLIEWFKLMRADKRVYKSEAVPSFPDGMTFNQVRDYKSKRVILGIGFCQGAQSILEQNPESYKEKREVQQFLDLFGRLFYNVIRFQKDITQQAHKQTYLISKWNYIRRFYDVFKWSPKKWNQFSGSLGDWEHGDDYEAAVAFIPANHAFGMIKEEMLRLAGYRLSEPEKPHVHEANLALYESWKREEADWQTYLKDLRLGWKSSEDYFEKYGFVNQIHDSIIYHCDKHLADECLENSLKIMREPSPVLADTEMCPNGFYVDADAKIGPDWASMTEVK